MGTQETHLGDTGLLFIIIAAFEDTATELLHLGVTAEDLSARIQTLL